MLAAVLFGCPPSHGVILCEPRIVKGIRLPIILQRPSDVAIQRALNAALSLRSPRILYTESWKVCHCVIMGRHAVRLPIQLDPAVLERFELTTSFTDGPSFDVDAAH